MNLSFANKKWIILGALCVLTFICFSYTRHNQFTNWDDDYYVTNQQYIKALTWDNLKVIFTEDITKNNYHPLCMLSLAINYHFSQMNPEPYYLTNIFIHILNVLLVFFLAIQLSRRLNVKESGQLFIAALSAALFGIHPMHVESVAWIAERKDVLYAFFYFLGLLSYLHYIDTKKMNWFVATYFLFVASCLSKPMAVVFPFSLLCLDFLLGRPMDKRLITEKIVFFLSSLMCGSYAFYTQHRTGAIASFDTLTLAERFMYASYGYVMYISKIFNPTYLSTFYPYPFRYINGYLNSFFYAAPLLAIAFLTIPIYLAYKKNREWFRVTVFGVGYFTVNVMFVLQFISVGAAIMSDRYSYVAYMGLFFAMAYFINVFIERMPAYKTGVMVLLACCIAALSYGTYARTYAWHDSETLLSDAIEKYPFKKDPDKSYDSKNSGIAMLSYKWLGNYYFAKGDYDKALENYEVLTTLRAADAKVYDKVAAIYTIKKEFSKADNAMNLSVAERGASGDGGVQSYLQQAMMYARKGDTTNALKNYVASFRLNKDSEKILADSCFSHVQQGQYEAAIGEYNTLMTLNTSNPFYYFYRGVAYFGANNVQHAIKDWEMAMKFQSKDVLQSASYNLSIAYDTVGNDSMAVYYIEKAASLGYQVKPDFEAKLKGKYEAQLKSRRKK
jgi:tetratricopeptide (TPR) repeat protein